MNVAKILNDLVADLHSGRCGSVTDRALADALIRGAGYMKFTSEGIEHVPFDSIQIAPTGDST